MTLSPHSGENDPFAAALRAAIAQRGLSLDRIRYHLIQRGHELSVATISYWQSGRSRPERASSIAAIAALEDILGLENGHLAAKLPARRRGSGPSMQSSAEAADAYLPCADDLMGRLGLSRDVSLTLVLVHDQVHIDAAGAEVAHHVKQLFVAERDDVDHYWAYYQATSQPFIESVHNCTVADVAELPDQGVMVAKMALSRTLAKGESILVEHRAGQREQAISDRTIERAFLHPVRSAHTEVRFDPARLPLAAERFTVVDGVEKVDPIVIVGRSVHALVLDFGPGLYGVRWEW
ncbi:MAG: hypothetical protein IPK37_02320 [Austwickia sp.]|jgi:hypothetical protein|nr:MAG: hypothetical protein IPK37_02320 [Austwickia sp.]